uniref:C2H2-type domain-containing protein n=1 Tax=Oncorhynchus tshawytscha TaxID=74940 RepID=A0A8C8I9L6_ONCTS
MRSLSYSPDKEEGVCCTEKEAIVKEEEEEEAVTIQKQVDGEAVSVKEEEDAFRVKEEGVTVKYAFRVKEEEEDAVLGVEGEITVTLEEDEEEKTGELINTSKYRERRDYCPSSGGPQQPHDAEEAEKSLSTSKHLKKHQQRPTGKKSHFCSDCGKSYSRSDSLKLHKRIHTGEKPYSCDQCGMRYSDKRSLIKHQKIHGVVS